MATCLQYSVPCSEEAKEINITFELTAGPSNGAKIMLDDIKIRQVFPIDAGGSLLTAGGFSSLGMSLDQCGAVHGDLLNVDGFSSLRMSLDLCGAVHGSLLTEDGFSSL